MDRFTLTPREALAGRIDADERNLDDIHPLSTRIPAYLPADCAGRYVDALAMRDDELVRRALDNLRRAVAAYRGAR